MNVLYLAIFNRQSDNAPCGSTIQEKDGGKGTPNIPPVYCNQIEESTARETEAILSGASKYVQVL